MFRAAPHNAASGHQFIISDGRIYHRNVFGQPEKQFATLAQARLKLSLGPAASVAQIWCRRMSRCSFGRRKSLGAHVKYVKFGFAPR